MHGRIFPVKNHFVYGIYYLCLPLSKLDRIELAYNKPGFMSFYDKDHGARDGTPLEPWARAILKEYGIRKADGEIMLVCMPRIFGYVFNPVSFWLCFDSEENLRAVLCEVNNTFGERHTYLCAHENEKIITEKDVLQAQKLFHVSPFLEREGHYTFRFDLEDGAFKTWIDFYDAEGKKKLISSLGGEILPLTKASCRKAFFTMPLIPMRAVMLIHWQAVKLLFKGIKYIQKPRQDLEKTSASRNLTKI
jgi:DUF1365 family protein